MKPALKHFIGLYFMVTGFVCFIEICLTMQPNFITLVATFIGSIFGHFTFKPTPNEQ